MKTDDDSTGKQELIAFRLGDGEFGVDVMAVREIRGWAAPTPLPGAPPYVRGVINLRGAVLPIVDLASRLGMPSGEPGPRDVTIVTRIGQQTVGLLVNAVSDILSVRDDAIQPTPDAASDGMRALVRGLLAVEGRMIGIIALDRLLPRVVEAA